MAPAPDASAPASALDAMAGDYDAGAPAERGRDVAPRCEPDGCSEGASRCEDGRVRRCARDVNGCKTWQPMAMCAHGCDSAGIGCAQATKPTATVASDGGSPSTRPSTSMDAGVEADGGGKNPLADHPEAATLHTQVLAAVSGVYATPPEDQPGFRVSTDLGWTFVHRDRIWTLFGDSWPLDLPSESAAPDDALGYMSLTDFPDGHSVEAYVAAHPAPMGAPAWHAAAPPLRYILKDNPPRAFAPMTLERDGMVLQTGTGHTPMTGFSNGRDDERAAAFTIMCRYVPVQCEAGSCDSGHTCDTEMGHDPSSEWDRVCVLGESQSCVRGPGYCQDRGTTLNNGTSIGRLESVLMRFEVGVMDEAQPSRFRSQSWDTRRFYNLTARTVSDFDPGRALGRGNDYRPAHGNDLERSGVFLWGRTQFGGIGVDGRDAQLYLAWVPMPRVDADGRIDWKPQFFAGLDDEGKPRFVERELDSQALDLDAAQDGEQPFEIHDVVSQMAITWLPSLERFVMFYGGDMSPQFLNAIFYTEIDKVQHDPQGSLFVRFAEQPWGPWSAPAQLLTAGDVSERAEPEGLYATGGILAHNRCTDATCARYEPTFRLVPGNNNGVLYGPNFVDPWTIERPGLVDLFWFVSTWNPYQVVLMKTSLTP